MERIEITRSISGIFFMQVCAENDATDEEILAVCNRKNPSGTKNGWVTVIRKIEDCPSEDNPESQLPVACEESPGRTHFLIVC